MRSFFIISFVLLTFLTFASPLFAHEVYVLDDQAIDQAITTRSPNPFSAAFQNGTEFFFWAFIAIVVVVSVFFISISRKLEEAIDPLLFKLKKRYGIFITRVTIGLGLMASGYYGGFLGPELPLDSALGAHWSAVLSTLLVFAGIFIVLGFKTRIAAGFGLFVYMLFIFEHGSYMFTYSNYFGELFVIFFLGQHVLSTDKDVLEARKKVRVMDRLSRFVEKYAFLILRVTFGFSLIFASLYAKFFHSQLAVDTVINYHLTDYFPFDPLFVVLGAMIIEILLGIFFIIGFEVRFASIFLLVFVTLSLIYFGEAVWPHIIFFGGSLALFVHGYDRYTLEGRFFKDAKHEPIL